MNIWNNCKYTPKSELKAWTLLLWRSIKKGRRDLIWIKIKNPIKKSEHINPIPTTCLADSSLVAPLAKHVRSKLLISDLTTIFYEVQKFFFVNFPKNDKIKCQWFKGLFLYTWNTYNFFHGEISYLKEIWRMLKGPGLKSSGLYMSRKIRW